MQYLNYTKTRANYSFKYSFGLVFGKIETVLFGFLCVVFLVVSRVNHDFSKDVSFAFIGISMPIVKAASFPFNAILNLLTNFGELVEAKQENEKIKEELVKLREFYIKSLNIHQENKALKKTLNFVTSKSTSFKVARVIGRSNEIFNKKIFIDAGEDRGIKEGAIVTGNTGVIGRIWEVGKNKSRLLLLTDANSRIPIITSKARARGILAGNNSGLMKIIYLSKAHNIEVGDWVFTSGDGDILPPGLLVGVVKNVKNNEVDVAMVEDVVNVDMVTIMDY